MTLLYSAYFPPISWFSSLWQQSIIEIEACENYQKGGFRNRCHIAGHNGIQRLSVPLEKGKHQKTPIRDVRISYTEPWQRLHWRTIKTAYGNAPFFEHYEAGLSVFFEKKHPFLFDLNLEVIQFFTQKWAWNGKITLSTTWQNPTDDSKGLCFNSPILNTQTNQPRPSLPAYAQVFQEKHGYLPDLSVLDLLMCCGKTGREYLTPLT
jgi:WbqC-like protein family